MSTFKAMISLISDMAGEAVWYKWTPVSSEPSEVEGGKQSNRFVGAATSEEDFGIFDAGEPANRAG